jgi:cytidylate kinase
MYRSLTLKALRKKVDLADESALIDLAHHTHIDLEDSPNGLKVYLDGEDVSDAIRTSEVTNHTFYIARAPGVREIMVDKQRDIGQRRNVVVEGRDVGTVVFPKAHKKFYLDADMQERSRRRIAELKQKGTLVDENKLSQELQDRDQKDLTRQVGALQKADDAHLIDSTHLSIEEVVQQMLAIIRSDGQKIHP